jgi:hypothetical protein
VAQPAAKMFDGWEARLRAPANQDRDLDIAVVRQLSPPQLPLDDGYSAIKEALEGIARYSNDALVLADPDAELDRLPVAVPVRVLGKPKNMAQLAGCKFLLCLDARIPRLRHDV